MYLQTAIQHARGDSLYDELFLSQPPLLIQALAPLLALFGASALAARAFVIASTLLLILGIRLTTTGLFGRAAGRVSVLLSLVCFPLFKYANLALPNIPSVACGLFAIYFLVRYNRDTRIRWVVLSAVAFAVAAGFKLLVPFYAFPLSFLMTFRLAPGPVCLHPRSRLLRIAAAHLVYAAVSVATMLVLVLPHPLHAFIEQVWSMGSSGVMGGGASFQDPKVLLDILREWFLLNPLPAVLTVWLLLRTASTERRTFSFLLVWLGSQLLFFLLMIRWLWTHHLVALIPILLIGASAGLAAWARALAGREAGRPPSPGRKPRLERALFGLALLAFLVPNLGYDLRKLWLPSIPPPGRRSGRSWPRSGSTRPRKTSASPTSRCSSSGREG